MQLLSLYLQSENVVTGNEHRANVNWDFAIHPHVVNPRTIL